MENYEDINKTDSILSRYDNYRINYKRKKTWNNSLSVILIQLIIAAALILVMLLFRFVPAFEPAFNAIRDFLQKDIFEGFGLFVRAY